MKRASSTRDDESSQPKRPADREPSAAAAAAAASSDADESEGPDTFGSVNYYDAEEDGGGEESQAGGGLLGAQAAALRGELTSAASDVLPHDVVTLEVLSPSSATVTYRGRTVRIVGDSADTVLTRPSRVAFINDNDDDERGEDAQRAALLQRLVTLIQKPDEPAGVAATLRHAFAGISHDRVPVHGVDRTASRDVDAAVALFASRVRPALARGSPAARFLRALEFAARRDAPALLCYVCCQPHAEPVAGPHTCRAALCNLAELERPALNNAAHELRRIAPLVAPLLSMAVAAASAGANTYLPPLLAEYLPRTAAAAAAGAGATSAAAAAAAASSGLAASLSSLAAMWSPSTRAQLRDARSNADLRAALVRAHGEDRGAALWRLLWWVLRMWPARDWCVAPDAEVADILRVAMPPSGPGQRVIVARLGAAGAPPATG